MTAAIGATGGAAAIPLGGAVPGASEDVASLLPAADASLGDPMEAVQLMMMRQSNQSLREGEQRASQQKDARAAFRRDQREAMQRAHEAEQQRDKGMFESLGLAGIVGVVTAQPLLVLVDLSVHMAGIVPKDLEKLEKDSLEVLNSAAEGALGGQAALAFLKDAAGGPQRMMATLVLAGMLVEKTEVLGERASAWAGAATSVVGGAPKLAAVKVLSDKDSAVAADVKSLERALGPDVMKYAQLGATIVAGVALTVSTAGIGAPIVATGLALSIAGFAMREVKVLREALGDMVGKEGAAWLAIGVSAVGAVGMAVGGTGATEGAVAVARMASRGVQGAAETVNALRLVRDTSAQFHFSEAMTDKREADHRVERVGRAMKAIAEEMKGEVTHQQKVSQLVASYFEARRAEAQAAHGMRG